MSHEVNIIERVLAAQNDIDAADNLIREYLPFIKRETAKLTGRIPVEGSDDELSIALMGFHEAIESYHQEKGAFLAFASIIIKRRIIDFQRHENRFKTQVSIEQTRAGREEGDAGLSSGKEDVEDRQALKWEIQQFVKELAGIGITLSDVAANCPKHETTRESCIEVVNFISTKPEWMEEILEKGKFPIAEVIKGTSVKKKTLERHRKYLMALLIIYFRGYDCMIDHLTEVFKSQKGGK